MENQGAAIITKSRDGIVTERVFYDAPLEMPIILVAGIAQEGTMGSTTALRLKDGSTENNQSHQLQHFVKHRCVLHEIVNEARNDPSAELAFARPVKP